MSSVDPKIPDTAFAAALHKLARPAPQGSPPELGLALARAFHRHHRRRRFIRTTVISVIALVLSGGSLWLRTAFPNRITRNLPAATSSHETAMTATPNPIAAHPPTDGKQISAVTARHHSRQAARTQRIREAPFVALPALALRAPDEELHVIRVEMPIASLRLLGAQVNDELETQRVTADLLVGPDGTPYAFRLIT